MEAHEVDAITGTFDHATLPANVSTGRDVWIERRASFERCRSTYRPGCVLGDRVRVHAWTTFNVEPDGTVEVGDDTVLVGATLLCAGRIRIGRRAREHVLATAERKRCLDAIERYLVGVVTRHRPAAVPARATPRRADGAADAGTAP